jgi:protein AFG1
MFKFHRYTCQYSRKFRRNVGLVLNASIRLGSQKTTIGLSLPEQFSQLVGEGKLKEDRTQLKLAKTLEKLRVHVEKFEFPGFNEAEKSRSLKDSINTEEKSVNRLRGLYIYGPVGNGKTMLMDMFYHSCSIPLKRRVHFHQFMLDVHHRIHSHKKELLSKFGRDRHINLSPERDSIKVIGKIISKEASLLCFDEFQVTDIADAVILSRLFKEIWSNGTVLVATSNRPPQALYSEGLNRQDFLPFIEQLEKECLIRQLDSQKDYRKSESIELHNTYFTPNSEENLRKLGEIYQQDKIQLQNSDYWPVLSQDEGKIERLPSGHCKIPVSFNRQIILSKADPELGICMVEFLFLCECDKGASDYKALTKYFHTVYMKNIPKMSKLSHNAARRFIILIDELYNHNIRFIYTCDADPSNLFQQETLKEKEEDIEVKGVQRNGDLIINDEMYEEVKDASSSLYTEVEGKVEQRRTYSSKEIEVKVTQLKDKLIINDEMYKEAIKYGRNYSGMLVLLFQCLILFLFGVAKAVERLCSGQQEEMNVYEGELASIKELGFAFERAASRLIEMSSQQYFNKWKAKYSQHIG